MGIGAILPDAPDVQAFWANLVAGRSSITEVPKERWDPELYYDADPRAPDKTYSKIGGWVRDWDWSPLEWRLPIPPRVGDAIDDAQKWAVACRRAALLDYGWPTRPIDQERTAVIQQVRGLDLPVFVETSSDQADRRLASCPEWALGSRSHWSIRILWRERLALPIRRSIRNIDPEGNARAAG